ncbi:DUF1653 domain-containing protein [candidate division WS5 bacterium]|uniref:DUF1653 domain-containing protein n=1 Tax=candidate division WS5 bacterium TaxID=2093353 RepID=A0A419DFN0_9BACT|nr:MAG: DUF1653 domain-containing protein [candidate division WS5 bacterium]
MKNSKKEIKLSKRAKSLKLGEYEHYKGKRYNILGVALHSETLEELVVYQALYGEGLTWVRPLDMFLDKKTLDDGSKVSRFTYVGE